jgi:nicotinamidase-related amidase
MSVPVLLVIDLQAGMFNGEPIAPRPEEAIVDKRTPDSFHETTLLDELAATDARRLIVVGAETEICVDTTCRRARSLGFDVKLVADAHSTWNNDTLTAEQIIRHTNLTLSGWFVRLVHAAEVGLSDHFRAANQASSAA